MLYDKDMKKWIYRIVLLAAICVFSFRAFQLYKIYKESKMIDQENEKLQEIAKIEDNANKTLTIDWTALKQSAPDVVGWVYVPGLDSVSFPIVQGSDNTYYLNHTTLGETNIRGSIFLDAGAAPDFSDENNVVYGHSVEGGGMFTSMDRFEDASFFETHPVFYVLTPSQNYKCDVLAFSKTTEGTSFYTKYDLTQTTEHANEMISQATYSRNIPVEGKHFITLSTCDLDYGFDSINRLVLVGVMEPTTEPIQMEE